MTGKVYPLSELVTQRQNWRVEKKKVVFTNGVFDILHRGHVEYLAASKSLGDILVVGINSDSSVRRIKGKLRPVVSETDRAFLVSQLKPVDAVCIFEEDTPLNIITAVKPDVLIKGADWKINNVVGKEVVEASGGKVLTIPLIPDRSTTGIIERILERFSGTEKAK
jgi:D-glycero-beta-D-manno-heptose 1-phosphate adenylyltransferase